MMRSPSTVLLLLSFLLMPSPVFAQDEPEDAIADALLAAHAQYDEEIESARQRLIEAMDSAVVRLEENVRIPIERRLEQLEEINTARTAFIEDGVALEAPLLRAHVDRYEREAGVAKRRCINAYEEAARAYGKVNKLEEARAVLEELEEFQIEREIYAEIESVEGDVAIAPFENGRSVFSNRRDYIIGELPQEVPFSKFTQVPAGGEAGLEITISRAGWVYIAVALGQRTPANVRPYLDDNRWEATDWSFTRGGRAADCFIFRKQFPRGTITLPRLDWNSPLVLIE